MTDVFLTLVDMSVAASRVALAVLLLRLVLKKAPKWISCLLWLLVAVRLICPFTPESGFSLMNVEGAKESVDNMLDGYVGPSSAYWDHTEEYEAAVNSGIEPLPGGDGRYYVLTGETPTTKVPILADYLAPVWVTGMGGMLAYTLGSYLRIRKKVAASVSMGKGIYLCDYIDTPFVLGVFFPRIYLPSAIDANAAAHVLAHERAHIQRKDHWWKPLGVLLLTIHWFNPILWLAYVLLCRDIELACDEKVIRNMDSAEKKSYSQALLGCSVPRYMVAACPLAFGEVGVKERVKTVLHYRKPAFWIVLAAVIVLLVTALCFLTDPVIEPFDNIYRVEEVVYRNLALSYYISPETAPNYQITDSGELLVSADGDEAAWVSEGIFETFRLTEENFEGYMKLGIIAYPEAPELRRENRKAWVLYPEHTNTNTFYYLMQQKDGSVYLAVGYNQNISWIYRLAQGSTVDEQLDTENASATPDPYAPADSLYQWTSNLSGDDVISTLVGLHEETYYSYYLTDVQEETLFYLLNRIPEEDIRIVDYNDVQWTNLRVTVLLCSQELQHFYLELTNCGVLISLGDGTENLYPELEPGESWMIHSDELEQFLGKLSYGGTWMLKDENRQAVKKILGVSFVQFFDPQIYGELLFVGCIYEDDKTALAVFESDGNGGYTLQRVTASEHLTVCPGASNVWVDRYISDGRNLYVFLNRNDILRQIQWIGEFETILTAKNDPSLIIVDVPENARTEYRLIYGQSGVTEYTDGESGKPFVTSAEYSRQYAAMKLFFFAGWEYEIEEYTEEYDPFGIRFRPEGEEGWVFLQFWPKGFGVCGTGLKTVPGGMSNGCMTETGYYDGNDIWSYITITNMPGSYVVLNQGADGWIPEYESELMTILENMVVADNALDKGHIQGLARIYAEDEGLLKRYDEEERPFTYATGFNYETGKWAVGINDPIENVTVTVYLDMNGVVVASVVG